MKQPSADQPREDDGYFGPDSVSWRLFADPSSRLGGLVALMLQTLNPAMIRLFDRTSVSADYDAGRDERTGRYIQTTIFGDKAHADAAAETVRAMHARAKWTDPRTGEVLEADRPEYLEWTHNFLVWGVLRAADAFGPELSTADQDRFVVEQHKSGEWMGIDPVRLPTTRAALDAYTEEQVRLDGAHAASGPRRAWSAQAVVQGQSGARRDRHHRPGRRTLPAARLGPSAARHRRPADEPARRAENHPLAYRPGAQARERPRGHRERHPPDRCATPIGRSAPDPDRIQRVRRDRGRPRPVCGLRFCCR